MAACGLPKRLRRALVRVSASECGERVEGSVGGAVLALPGFKAVGFLVLGTYCSNSHERVAPLLLVK